VSSLAIGADQLFASLVAQRGGQIHAVIPFDGYERTFSPHNVDAYHYILSKADLVEVLQTSGTDEDAYLAAGKRVVELSDILIAVWNGQPAKGKGGTADIVAYARDNGVPLVHLNPVDRTITRKLVTRKYHTFLASRMYREQSALNDLRMEIHRLGLRLNRPVWVAEVAAPELNQKPNEEVQIACMQHVWEIPAFICIIDGSYGKPWNIAQLCVLELEIIAATLAGKPFHFFLLDPYQEDPRTESLLRVVRLMRPELATIKPQSAEMILESLRERLSNNRQDSQYVIRSQLDYSSVLASEADLNIQFLNENFVPLNAGEPGEKDIRALLSELSSETDQATRLVYLWMAIRHLCAAPYNDPTYDRFLPLWDQTLSLWAGAASWYGLHGLNFLGRLAAVNTLLKIRERTGSKGDLSIQGTKGALASEYYSIAKTVRSRTLRRQLLNQSLIIANQSLEEPQSDPSGLLGIRGSILQALGRLEEGLHDYQEMLSLRQSAGEDSGRIGEAEVELGWGYFRLWLTWRMFMLDYFFKAQHFLSHGTTLLEHSERPEFAVRALRKLGIFYAATFRFSRARRVMERAHDLALRRKMQDQLRQMLPVLRVLRKLTWTTKL
jgi:tetratricopeptide (TPR) repeat protein